MNWLTIAQLIIPGISKIFDRVIPDPEKRAQAEIEMQKTLKEAQVEFYKAQAVENESKKDIIVTEMGQASWFSDWRAKLMTMCTVMIGFNWIVVPVANSLLYFLDTQITPNAIPSEAWLLLNIGLGGYIGERTMTSYQNGKVEKARVENDKAIFDVARKIKGKPLTQADVDAINAAKE